MPEALCRSCKAPIIWAESETTGKPIPVDAEPVEIGNLVLVPRPDSLPPFVRYQRAGFGAEKRYLNHFATCPDAKKWKR